MQYIQVKNSKKNKKDKKPFHDREMERKTLGGLWKTTAKQKN